MPNRILQSSLFSKIRYLFYNLDFFDQITKCKDTLAIKYINNIAILTIKKATKKTCKNIHQYDNICKA